MKIKRPKICKGCLYGHPYWGACDKQGNRIMTKFYCTKRNKVPLGLKSCAYKKGKSIRIDLQNLEE